MQKFKKKKKQKNRVEFSQKNITPGKHERIGNLNLYSEEIVKELIDKLISLTMTKLFREKVESKISDFCFEGVIRALNLTISISNIEHDIDNIYDVENISDDKKRLNTDENRYKIVNHNKCNKARNKVAEKDMFEYTTNIFYANDVFKNMLSLTLHSFAFLCLATIIRERNLNKCL